MCEQLRKMATTTKLISDVYAEIYTGEGALTASFLEKVCALDCTGTGGTGSTSTTLSSSTTPAPVSVVDLNMYAFSTSVDGGGGNQSKMRRIDGGVFDSNKTFSYFGSEITLAGNKTVVGSALHPSTGVLWVLYYDGTLGAPNSNATLATVDKTDGSVVDVAAVTNGGSPLGNLANANLRYRISFDPTDSSLWLLIRNGNSNYIYTVNTTTGAMTLVGLVDELDPSPQSSVRAESLFFNHDGTPFVTSKDANNVVKVFSFSKTTDAVFTDYLPAEGSAAFSNLTTSSVGLLRANRFHLVSHNEASEILFQTNLTALNYLSEAAPVSSQPVNVSSSLSGLETIAYLAT